jgi:hypothetical protein
MSKAIHGSLVRAVEAVALDLDRSAARDRILARLRQTKALGFIVYQGPSPVDGAPIVVIATNLAKASGNDKTGALVQTWILRADMDPVAASKASADASICGDCPHRHSKGGACYVTIFRAPRAVFDAYKRGRYLAATDQDLTDIGLGFAVRAGSYGDPAMVPGWVWALMTPVTAYSHQWRREDAADLAAVAMASVDSSDERAEAKSLGFRTFRIIRDESEIEQGEILCPATTHGIQCADCGLCLGGAAGADIGIVVHGPFKKRLTVIQ